MNLQLWLFAQRLIGGTWSKQRLALSHYRGGSVLEIGCSVGNISDAFVGKTQDFLGQDIDHAAIEVARKRLPQFTFTSAPLSSLSRSFDYVMIAGVLHHVDDDTARDLIRQAKRLVSASGTIMSYDPLPVRPGATLPRKIIGKLEAGQYLRPMHGLTALYGECGVSEARAEVFALPAWRYAVPEIFDLGVIVVCAA